MPVSFEIVAGTYEQFLLGYKVKYSHNEWRMDKSFAIHSHFASIRSVSSSKRYLASGGADDSIYLYDMFRRTESGKLIHHNDTVTCLAFTPDASHLLTCSSDGTVAAVRCGNWQLEKHWQKPHKGLPVNTLAIHPSGRIALSAGADGVLRTWNLVKGRQAYATNLVPRLKTDAKNVHVLNWSPNGETYLLAANCRVDLYSTQTAGIVDGIELDSKVTCVEFLDDALIAIGTDNGRVLFYDVRKFAQTLSEIAHSNRIKSIVHRYDLLVTASSLGEIKLWKYTKRTLTMLNTVSCDARITCLSVTAWNNTTLGESADVDAVKEDGATEERARNVKLGQRVTVEYDGKWDVVDANVSNEKPKHEPRGEDERHKNGGNLVKRKKKKKDAQISDVDDGPGVKKRKKREGNGEYNGDSEHLTERRKMTKCKRTAWNISDNVALKGNPLFSGKSKKVPSEKKRERSNEGR